MTTEREASFWCVAPIGVIKDRRISQSAKLLYCLVTALQAECGYCYASNRYLADGIGLESEASIKRLLRELSEAGYLAVQVIRDDRNAVVERRIFPTIQPAVEAQAAPNENELTPPGKNVTPPDENNTTPPDENEPYNRVDYNILPPKAPQGGRKRKEHKTEPDHKPERFEKFWKFYPRNEAKQAAIRAWDKLKPSDALIDEMAKALKRQMQTEDWKRNIGIPYAATWLNNARWTDELPVPEVETGPRREYISDDEWDGGEPMA